ncbi:MAG: hypothetical protein Q7K26_00605 [bacterium]|nr:hypothetical protein [bacterium]
MKKDDFVIHQKGTGRFYSSGADHAPLFSNFFVARSYSSLESALETAQRVQHYDESMGTLQIIQIPDVTNLDIDSLDMIDNLILIDIPELTSKIEVLPERHFRWLKNSLIETRDSLERQLVFAGMSFLDGVVPVREVTRITKLS